MEFKSNLIKDLAKSIIALEPAVNPNDDPSELYKQVRPLLMKMGLSNFVDRAKLQLVQGMVQGPNSLYQVCLRRLAVIDKDIIARIKRNEDNFEKIIWDSRAIQVFVWYPYQSPKAPITPAIPGTPQ